jgi:hypothetical protein
MESLTFEQLSPYQSKIQDLVEYLDITYDHVDLGDKLLIIFDDEPWLLDTSIEPFDQLVMITKVLGLKSPNRLTFERFVKQNRSQYAFWASTVAYKDGKIDLEQYIKAISNTLMAFIYQGFNNPVSHDQFNKVVNHLVEFLPTTVVTFNERMAGITKIVQEAAIVDMNKSEV